MTSAGHGPGPVSALEAFRQAAHALLTGGDNADPEYISRLTADIRLAQARLVHAFPGPVREWPDEAIDALTFFNLGARSRGAKLEIARAHVERLRRGG